MRSSLLLAGAAAFASAALAADCAAQNIVNACVSGYQDRIDGCRKNGNDWICLCDVYRDVLTCYNNCPDSNEKPPVQNQVTQFCTAAEPLRAAASSSMASVASVAKTATTAATSTAASATGTASGTSSATGSGTAATAPAFATGAASALTTPAGAAIVALFAAAGLF